MVVKVHRTQRRWTGTIDPQGKEAQERMTREVHSLIAYPLVFFLLNIPPFINRIHGAADEHNPEPVLWIISAILFPPILSPLSAPLSSPLSLSISLFPLSPLSPHRRLPMWLRSKRKQMKEQVYNRDC